MRNFVVCSAVLATLFALANSELQAIAYLNGPEVFGNITFTQQTCDGPVEIDIFVEGLSSNGTHGFHIHEKGDLGNDCLSTGAHYNPHGMNHAAQTEQQRHVGDLGNIQSDDYGQAIATISDSMISLGGQYSIIGRGVVVHEGEDDLGLTNHPDSLTTGNAGARLACGVVGIVELSPEDYLCRSSGNILSGSIAFTFGLIAFILYQK